MTDTSGHGSLLLEMRRISKSFPGVKALQQVDFQLRAGEVHVLLGENGAGKSTLMKILSGAYRKDRGEILLTGRPVEIFSPSEAQRLGISTIYQEFNLIPQMSVAENIFLGREPLGPFGMIDRSRLRSEAQLLLSKLGVPIPPEEALGALSVAEQQMVEVAKALSLDARILIMDEPTSALSDNEIRQLFEAIRGLKRQGVGIVYISHRLEELREIGDRVTVLRDGRCIATHAVDEVSLKQLIREMANRDLDEHFPRRRRHPGEELLRVKDLSAAGRLRGINLELYQGEILGLAGLVGSGRTALARTLFGLEPWDTGTLFVHGRAARFQSPRQAIAAGVGFLTEDRKAEGLVLNLSLRENVSLPNLRRLSSWGVVNRAAEQKLSQRYVDDLQIKTPGLEQPVAFLSGGNQQKVVLSKWLAGETDVFLFDEPTRGIDVGSKVEIYELMNRLTENGAGILMISSELPEILGMSDRIVVMHEGSVAAEFHHREATQEKILQAALGPAHASGAPSAEGAAR